VVRGGYTQAALGFSRAASKVLVNGRPNKMVNIASIKMMKKIFWVMSSLVRRHCEERSDEAIQFFLLLWIASLRSQ
jgi:hypothetical protein